ncbi:hypothetical protein MARA_32340 [Mycolicibacterium arabiense]|uniref:Uncharacterized protein n=1 Tax=Mycolicibacterium arabiense TaxID=1286181 RepID=A0A7I7S0H1_9MYCO|nr:hypothetical protein MARA_32340 [Mycolicibacterium arabiense]
MPVMIKNRIVPMPENSSVVAGGKPVSTGTRNVAPNMATTCWAPIPMVRGQLSRSSGATTAASRATGFQAKVFTIWNYTPCRARAHADQRFASDVRLRTR